jgi:hypothetical protein
MYRINKYYSKRAQEYEQIYQRDDPIRQSEQNKIAEEITFLLLKSFKYI